LIPNAIDVEKWKQIDKSLARQLPQVTKNLPDLQLIVFGQLSPENPHDLGTPIKLL